MKKRYVFDQFTERELKIIELRTGGMKPGEIAKELGCSRQAVYATICRVYSKTGLDNTALLTRWAVGTTLDEALPAESPEDLPVPEERVVRTKPRIRMGRLRRALLAD